MELKIYYTLQEVREIRGKMMGSKPVGRVAAVNWLESINVERKESHSRKSLYSKKAIDAAIEKLKNQA